MRHNLNDWQSDQNRIQAAAQSIAKLMANRENYETFKQDFLGDHRADTPFNMQLFGNPNNDRLPENGTIKLNSLDNRTIAQSYVIANGIKTNLEKVEKLVFELARADILAFQVQ